MAASQSYLNFILEQLSGLDDISYRKMIGEYIIYYNGKIAAYLCDDRLLVKILSSTAGCTSRTALHRSKRYAAGGEGG